MSPPSRKRHGEGTEKRSRDLVEVMERKAEPSWAVEAPATLLRCWLECVKGDKSACGLGVLRPTQTAAG